MSEREAKLKELLYVLLLTDSTFGFQSHWQKKEHVADEILRMFRELEAERDQEKAVYKVTLEHLAETTRLAVHYKQALERIVAEVGGYAHSVKIAKDGLDAAKEK